MFIKTIFKGLYSKIPFKGIVFAKLRALVRFPLFIYQHLLFEEPFSVSIEGNSPFHLYNQTCIENDIFWNGLFHSWEQSTLFQWLTFCRVSNGYIIDVGANTGVYSLISASSNKVSTIFAFEPHPVFYQSLCNNIALNHFSERIKPIQIALSDAHGNASIADYACLGGQICANTTTLDLYCEQNGLGPVDLIKVDIEGMETAFFRGAIQTIRKYRPTIIVEILDGDFPATLQSFLKDLGYTFFQINDNSLSPPSPVTSLTGLQSNHRNFLLLGSVLPLSGRPK